MIKTARDYFEMELAPLKGKIMSLEELPVDLAFMTMPADVHKTMVVPYLVSMGKLNLYIGAQVNSTIIPTIIEKVGELKVFNENKEKGPFLNTQKITAEIFEELKDLQEKDQEEFQKQFNERYQEEVEKQGKEIITQHKAEVEATTIKVGPIVHDDFLLVPKDIELREYQRLLKSVDEEGYSIYSEKVFVEIVK